MNTKTYLAAIPAARKLWRWMPGPLRVAAIVLIVAFAVSKVFGDGDEEPAADAAGS